MPDSKPINETPTGELEADLLICLGTIEAYQHNLDKSAEHWKAVEYRNKIQFELKRRENKD